MIVYLASSNFQRLMKNPKLHLPIRWDGRDFEKALENLLDEYYLEIDAYCSNDETYNSIEINRDRITLIGNGIVRAVKEYHDGYPERAYRHLNRVMRILIEKPIREYQKSGNLLPGEDTLKLYRVRKARKSINYARKDIFHVPISSRSMISTCRYSIAGYPSLYLSTSLDLCIEETGGKDKALMASRFKLARVEQELDIRVIELGVKPQDFGEQDGLQREYQNRRRELNEIDLTDNHVRENYLMWYPLIAACSFIRADKNAPFASEYIVPQLVMQWLRLGSQRGKLLGLRYFSCSSVRASEMGFDYVFPVNNHEYEDNYCSVLRKAILLTQPVLYNEYDNTWQCEEALNRLDLDRI